MPSQELTERNQAIVDAVRAGVARQQIADEHGITLSRVGQIVARADERDGAGGSTRRRKGRNGNAAAGEKVRLRIGNLAKAVLVTGQAYQDPRTP